MKAKSSREASKESVVKWSEQLTDEHEINVSANQMQFQFQTIMLDDNQDLLRSIEQRWNIMSTFSSSSAMIFHQHVLVMYVKLFHTIRALKEKLFHGSLIFSDDTFRGRDQ